MDDLIGYCQEAKSGRLPPPSDDLVKFASDDVVEMRAKLTALRELVAAADELARVVDRHCGSYAPCYCANGLALHCPTHAGLLPARAAYLEKRKAVK